MPDDMTGVLVRNEKKQSKDSADHVGWIIVEGKRYSLNAWVRESAKTKKRGFVIRVYKVPEEGDK